jgi:hypothetical protein
MSQDPGQALLVLLQLPAIPVLLLMSATMAAAGDITSIGMVAAAATAAAAVTAAAAAACQATCRGHHNDRHGGSSSESDSSSDSGSSSNSGSSSDSGSSSSIPGDLRPLPLLQELHLSDFTVSHISTLLTLTHLQSVTQLKIGTVQRRMWYCIHPPDETPLLSALLSSFTCLHHLLLASTQLELEAVSAISSSSLTRLDLLSRRFGEPEYDDRLPCISTRHPMPQLGYMKVLNLQQCHIDASVLATCRSCRISHSVSVACAGAGLLRIPWNITAKIPRQVIQMPARVTFKTLR